MIHARASATVAISLFSALKKKRKKRKLLNTNSQMIIVTQGRERKKPTLAQVVTSFKILRIPWFPSK